MSERIKKTISNFQRNNMNGYHVKDKDELLKLLDEIIHSDITVGCGDSVTLEQLEVFEYLRNRKLEFYDKHNEGLTSKDKQVLYIKNFSADVFITGTNAITENGELINIDGNGSRVAPMLYGPKKVIIVVSANKIMSNVTEGMERVRQIAAPLDAKRLGKATPCVKTGKCYDCKSKDRICNDFVVIARQFDPNRIYVIIVDGEYGY